MARGPICISHPKKSQLQNLTWAWHHGRATGGAPGLTQVPGVHFLGEREPSYIRGTSSFPSPPAQPQVCGFSPCLKGCAGCAAFQGSSLLAVTSLEGAVAAAGAGGSWHVSCRAPSWRCCTCSSLGSTCWTEAETLSFGRKFWMIAGPEAMTEAGWGPGDLSWPLCGEF